MHPQVRHAVQDHPDHRRRGRALLAGFIPLSTLADLVNIGTLFAFVLVSIGVWILRRTRPDLERSFRVPLVPLLPILSALACLYLMLNLPGRDLDPVRRLDGRRRRRLLRLRPAAQPVHHPGLGREDAAAANAARRRTVTAGLTLRGESPRETLATPEGGTTPT